VNAPARPAAGALRPGRPDVLEGLLREAGVDAPRVVRVAGEARFPSIRSWMHTDVRGWTLSEKLDDAQFELLVGAAEQELGRFVASDGSVRFAHPALIATGRKS